MKHKRLFVAIRIHPNEQFLRLYYQLKKALQHDRINWVKEENIHVTLKFIGETPEDRIDDIISAVDDACLDISPFELALEGLGIFGSRYNPRAIWFGIRKEPMLISLAQNVFREMDNIGFEKDRQNFVPHLTIGRVKLLEDKNYFQQTIDKHKPGLIQTIRVEEVLLVESVLQPEGPTYYVLESFIL